VEVPASALLPYPPPAAADTKLVDSVARLWRTDQRFVVLSGPPGTGKTRGAEDIVNNNHYASRSALHVNQCRVSVLFPDFRVRTISDEEIRTELLQKHIYFVWDLVVMHPQYTYEDLIRGLRLESQPKGNGMGLVTREGALGFISRVAAQLQEIMRDNLEPLATLVLDEFNRAPIGQLFGEAIYAIDRRGTPVTTPYVIDSVGPELLIPRSLQLIGTMNSIDRSTSYLDMALRRRFTTVSLLSNPDPIRVRWSAWPKASKVCLATYEAVKNLVVNARQLGEIQSHELVLGQSYFIPPNEVDSEHEALEWLWTSFVYKIVPTLGDYEAQALVEFSEADKKLLPGGKGLRYWDLAAIPMTDVPEFQLA
jgi:hypothetical protein